MTKLATTEARKRLRGIMSENGVTIQDIARAIGRSPGTIRNVCTRSAPSKTARQLITDFFGRQIWPGISPRPYGSKANGDRPPAQRASELVEAN